MAEGGTWEFKCPQYVDFLNEIEEKTLDSQSLGGDTPTLGNRLKFKSNNFMKKRFAGWNNCLSTPVNFINANRQTNTTDSEKIKEIKKRLSRSEGSVNKVGICLKSFKENNICYPKFTHKRSISEGDLIPQKKFPATSKKIPATPMCLKRAMKKDKAFMKTTEELELEKIAELQSLTLKHLRFNERNMRKLKLKQKPPTVPKAVYFKNEKKEKSAFVMKFQKDLQEVTEKLNSNKIMRFAISKPTEPSERRGAVSTRFDLEPADRSSAHILQPSVSGLLKENQVFMDEEKEIVNEAQCSHSFHSSHLKNQNNKENFFTKMAPKSDDATIRKTFKF